MKRFNSPDYKADKCNKDEAVAMKPEAIVKEAMAVTTKSERIIKKTEIILKKTETILRKPETVISTELSERGSILFDDYVFEKGQCQGCYSWGHKHCSIFYLRKSMQALRMRKLVNHVKKLDYLLTPSLQLLQGSTIRQRP